MDIDDPTPPEQLPCTVRTFVRPLDRFPPNFEARAGMNGKGVISAMMNERVLLNNLLSETNPVLWRNMVADRTGKQSLSTKPTRTSSLDMNFSAYR